VLESWRGWFRDQNGSQGTSPTRSIRPSVISYTSVHTDRPSPFGQAVPLPVQLDGPVIVQAQPPTLRSFLAKAVAPAWLAARKRLGAMILIQVCGAVLVAAYYTWPSVQEAMGTVGAVKERGGLWFAIITSVAAGAIVPEVAKMAVGERRWPAERWRDLAHTSLMFGLNGVVGDRFYVILTTVVGTEAGFTTVVRKMLLDTFVFTPFVSLPIFLFLVLLREERWSLRRFVGRLDAGLVSDRMMPILIPCWIYWIPLQACLYSLPLSLQFPFAVTCVSAWSLVLIFVTKRMDRAAPASP
jgi:hypothetical protein